MNKGRVFALSDLHGEYNLWKQIKSFLQPNDKIYFLGDAADRGPDGWKLIKELYNDSRIIYLKGNHEDMLVQAMREYIDYDRGGSKCRLLCNNGGEQTLYSWIGEGMMDGWIPCLHNLPLYTAYKNAQGHIIHLSHAGFTPWVPNGYEPTDHDLIWGREHYLDEPELEEISGIVVHGHTPTPYVAEDLRIKDYKTGALWYCYDHKVDIDCATFATGISTLLDLDTFDEHIFSY